MNEAQDSDKWYFPYRKSLVNKYIYKSLLRIRHCANCYDIFIKTFFRM